MVAGVLAPPATGTNGTSGWRKALGTLVGLRLAAVPERKESLVGMTVGDAVLSRLRDWGTEYVFAYPGDGINGLLSAWVRANNEPVFVQARHEEMAAFEAVGYAKFSG